MTKAGVSPRAGLGIILLAGLAWVPVGRADAEEAGAPVSAPNAVDVSGTAWERGAAAFHDEDFSGAVGPLAQVSATDAHYLSALRMLGASYIHLGQRDAARKIYEHYLELDPGADDVRDYWRTLSAENGESVQADPDAPIQSAGTAVSDAYARGLADFTAGDDGVAAASFAEVSPDDPHFATALRLRAVCLAAQGESISAQDAYEAYLQLKPGDEAAAAALARLKRTGQAPLEGGAGPEKAPKFGGRLDFGLGFNQGSGAWGFPVNEEDGYADQGFSGLSGSLEALYDPLPWLEVSLGCFPLQMNQTASSSSTGQGQYGNESATDTSTQELTFLPFMASFYMRPSVFTPKLHLVAGAGLGFGPGATRNVTGNQDYSENVDGGTATWNAQRGDTDTFSSGFATQVTAGLEYDVDSSWTISLLYRCLNYQAPRDQVTGYNRIYNAAGVEYYDDEWTYNYASSPTPMSIAQQQVSTSSSTAGNGNTTTVVTTTFNDGAEQSTKVVTTVTSSGGSTLSTNTVIHDTVSRPEETESWCQGEILLGVTVRF
jgi:Flp pilus assembly protein TadD